MLLGAAPLLPCATAMATQSMRPAQSQRQWKETPLSDGSRAWVREDLQLHVSGGHLPQHLQQPVQSTLTMNFVRGFLFIPLPRNFIFKWAQNLRDLTDRWESNYCSSRPCWHLRVCFPRLWNKASPATGQTKLQRKNLQLRVLIFSSHQNSFS